MFRKIHVSNMKRLTDALHLLTKNFVFSFPLSDLRPCYYKATKVSRNEVLVVTLYCFENLWQIKKGLSANTRKRSKLYPMLNLVNKSFFSYKELKLWVRL